MRRESSIVRYARMTSSRVRPSHVCSCADTALAAPLRVSAPLASVDAFMLGKLYHPGWMVYFAPSPDSTVSYGLRRDPPVRPASQIQKARDEQTDCSAAPVG